MGAITDSVRRIVPATYDAMLVATTGDSSRIFSLEDLQALADYVKYRLFSTAVTAAEEASAFSPFQNQFLGKLTTLQFIPPAIDYWDSQLSSIVATGTGEVANFRDHLNGLVKIWEKLSREVLEEALILGISLKRAGLIPKVTYGDNGRKILITPDPQTFPPLHNSRNNHYRVPWTVLP